MSIKEQAIAIIRRLPEDAGIKDIEEELALLAALQVAEMDIQSGRLLSSEAMKARLQSLTTDH
jgi:hypothetical protein